MKIQIKLLSDLCTCSGETYNSIVDTDVTYDENGIPYIPAKRIRGCIREAGLEMLEFGLISQQEYEKVFGKEGNQNSAFSLSNAYISDYEEVTEALRKTPFTELKSQQNVLDQYTATRTQTAVDLRTGVADKNSLRTIRVVRKGLTFEADCNWKPKVSKGDSEKAFRPEILGQAVSLVKHMGMSRTRGLGLVRMKLSDTAGERKQPHVLFDKGQLSDRNKITYKITLKSPMICKSPQGNQAATQDYIAGSKVLGLIAEALKDDGYQKLTSQGEELIVSNAYPVYKGKRTVPARISLQKVKDQSFEKDGTMCIKDMLLLKSPKEIEGKQMTPANIPYIDENGTILDVSTQISYHHQRPADKSTGHATGLDKSTFYQLASISEGQSFCGYIIADRAQAEQIMERIAECGEIRMGYGKSSEFGAVEFELVCAEPLKTVSKTCTDAIVTLASDVLLYNEMGMLTTDVRVLEKTLREMTGAEDLILSHPFLKFETIGGFNVTWKHRKPVFHALGKGSTFLVHSEKGIDIGTLNGAFAGERVSEGFGELLAEELPESLNVTVRKPETVSETDSAEKSLDYAVIQKLLEAEFDRRMQEKVREKLETKKAEYKKNVEGLNAAVAKLRIIFKDEDTYEAMDKQIEGIEKEEKNQLCRDLFELINPENVKKEAIKEMQQYYRLASETPENEDKLYEKMSEVLCKDPYKDVYKAYLAELKYFVKIAAKEGEH